MWICCFAVNRQRLDNIDGAIGTVNQINGSFMSLSLDGVANSEFTDHGWRRKGSSGSHFSEFERII